jgi:hypothetical protein
MKSFYEMLMILEGESPFSAYTSHKDELRAYEMIDKALRAAGIQWDQDEFGVLYGKWVDMTMSVGPNRNERVQGVILPEEIKEDEDHYGAYGVGYEVNNKRFYPTQIEEIHGIRVAKKYEDIISDYHHEMDYQSTLKSLPY